MYARLAQAVEEVSEQPSALAFEDAAADLRGKGGGGGTQDIDKRAARARLGLKGAEDHGGHPRGLQRARTEWSMFKRRHVWDLVLSMYGTMLSSAAAPDHRFAQQLEDVMLAAAAIPHVAQDLITRRGLLGWITLRIASERPTSERAVFWYTWLWTLCAPPSLPPHATLARLERLDAYSTLRVTGDSVPDRGEIIAEMLTKRGAVQVGEHSRHDNSSAVKPVKQAEEWAQTISPIIDPVTAS